MATKSSKKYKGVYCDNKGKIFYQIDLGIDPVTGKRVQKKARKNQYGKTFETMKEAYAHFSDVSDQEEYYTERKKVATASHAFNWKGREAEIRHRWISEYEQMYS